MMDRPKIFVSYSSKNRDDLEKLQPFLKPLERNRLIDYWADTRLEGGDRWEEEIDEALDDATVALLLISEHFCRL